LNLLNSPIDVVTVAIRSTPFPLLIDVKGAGTFGGIFQLEHWVAGIELLRLFPPATTLLSFSSTEVSLSNDLTQHGARNQV
jgi:hypothetical protein